MKWVWAGVAALVMVGVLLPTGIAAAQDYNGPSISPVAEANGDVEEAGEIDFDGHQAKIDRTRRTLIAIAGLMTVALIAYWWHTVPSRRLRVATKRLADRRATISRIDPDTASICSSAGPVDHCEDSISQG